MKKKKKKKEEQSSEMLNGIIEIPGDVGDHRRDFLRHDPCPWPPFVGQLETGTGDEEGVTDAGTAKPLSIVKAPGSDGGPNLALKVAIADASGLLCSNALTKEFI